MTKIFRIAGRVPKSLDRIEDNSLVVCPFRRNARLISIVDPDAIHRSVREAFGDRYLHKPKDPEVDKDLVKAEIAEGDLGKYGLKLDQDETFYAEPERARAAEV
jgi:hypothetical protein